jgi:hypothetical protein
MAFRKFFHGRNLRFWPPEWVSERGILLKINFKEARQNFDLVFFHKKAENHFKTNSEY